tara:strand:- start:1817 stop:2668 length:852 start_codon:yes stop_codon:yes gene_type:complete
MSSLQLSIIIAHYCTDKSSSHYTSFLETLNRIKKQCSKNHKIEIIIADDGSDYSVSTMNNYSNKMTIDNDPRKLFLLENTELKNWLDSLNIENNLITKWLYIPKLNPCMSKSRLWNFASQHSQSENLFFLDDDNYFISNNSIDAINDLFNEYEVIFGQIKDSSNKLRAYSSNRVQGTTLGIKKEVLKKIGGFGVWTEKISCGIDSDLWIKLFNYHKKNKLEACYTNRIQTYDSCSKRWKKYTKIFKDYTVRKEFMHLYGIKNYKNVKYNPSRDKRLWIKNLID